jgi:hypothetical protein
MSTPQPRQVVANSRFSVAQAGQTRGRGWNSITKQAASVSTHVTGLTDGLGVEVAFTLVILPPERLIS